MINPEQKRKIVNEINSEDELRKELIIPLFKKADYKAYDNQGPDEKGTDVFLSKSNFLGETEYTSIVLKKGKISNSASSANGMISTIQNQVYQAKSSIISHPEIRDKVRPSSIWVVTNDSITRSSKDQIKTEKDNGTENLHFIDDVKLVELIDRYWPEFYEDRRPFISQYKSVLSEFMLGVDLSEYGVCSEEMESIIIPTLLTETRKSYANDKRTPTRNITPVVLARKSTKVDIVTGEAGSGKTTLIDMLAIDILEEKIGIPIKISARNFNLENIESCYNSIFDGVNLKSFNESKENIKRELENEGVIVLIDALDEISSNKKREALLGYITEIAEKYSSIVKFIVTTRPEIEKQVIAVVGTNKTYQIVPMEFRQVMKFFHGWFSKSEAKAQKLITELKERSLLEKMPKTPLTLTLLAILYQTKEELPSTLTELYGMFTELLLGKWDIKKGIQGIESAQRKSGYLRKVAYDMQSGGVTEISRDRLSFLCQNYFSETLGNDINVKLEEKFLDEIISRSGLLSKEGGNYRFKHLSFQEYFCAQELFTKETLKSNLKVWLHDDWWSEVLFFCAGSLKNIDDLVPAIIDDKFEKDLVSCVTVGSMLQAAFETSINNKIKLIDLASHQVDYLLNQVIDDLKEMSDDRIPYFIPYAIVFEFLSDNYSSTYLEKALLDKELDGSSSLDSMSSVFRAIALLKSGNKKGVEYLIDNSKINSPILLLILDMTIESYEHKHNGGTLSNSHKSIRRKIKRNMKGVRAILNKEINN